MSELLKDDAVVLAAELAKTMGPARLGIYQVAWQMSELVQMAATAETEEDFAAAQKALAEYVKFAEVQRVDDVAAVIKYLTALVGNTTNCGIIDQEIDRLRSVKAEHERALAYIKDLVRQVMEMGGVRRVDSGRNKIRIQANSQPSVVIDDAAAVPDQYIDTTITMRLEDWKACQVLLADASIFIKKQEQDFSRSRIAAAIESGQSVPGAHLERGEHLRVA